MLKEDSGGALEPKFFVYVVENVRQADPANFTLEVLGGEKLRRRLERAKVADCDSDA